MASSRIVGLAQSACRLPGYLRRPLTGEQALAAARQRVAARTERFLAAVRTLVYANPAGPYCRLLRWAGVEAGDLEAEVRRRGLDQTLSRLYEAGVYVSLNEFRGLEPISRPGLLIEPNPLGFTNPLITGGLSGQSSGTRSGGTSIDYAWAFLEEEAVTERLLFDEHGLTHAELAMWMPVLPGIAGLHNLLLHLKCGPAVTRWFSQAPVPAWGAAPVNRAALEFVRRGAALMGHRVPVPDHVTLTEASVVAEWLGGRSAGGKTLRVLKAYASSATRAAAAAVERGFDLQGQVVFTGGEPLTEGRRRFLEGAGLRVHPRYATTEGGMVGAACREAGNDAPDRMHVYLDRLAVIAGTVPVAHEGHELRSLAFTSLSLHAPRVLLNTDLGDWGVLEERACGCTFGRVGMHTHVSRITSPEKLTGEGMSLLSSEMHRIVGAIVERHGGSPEDFQFWESHDARGMTVLTLAIDPAIAGLDEAALIQDVLTEMSGRSGGSELAARLWRDAGLIRVVREKAEATRGFKTMPIVRRPDA